MKNKLCCLRALNVKAGGLLRARGAGDGHAAQLSLVTVNVDGLGGDYAEAPGQRMAAILSSCLAVEPAPAPDGPAAHAGAAGARSAAAYSLTTAWTVKTPRGAGEGAARTRPRSLAAPR